MIPPHWLIVLTLVAEAAGINPAKADIHMARVYTVIVNRAGTTEEEQLALEVLRPYQFSCWRNAALMERTKKDKKSIALASAIVKNSIIRPEVGQARHYLTHRLYHSTKKPLWARKGHVVLDEGVKGHVFLEGVDD